VFSERVLTSVQIEDLLLLADPEEPGLYLSRFKQVLVGPNGPVTMVKRLYWMRRSDSEWRIVSEDNG
jgi:hypothetical protein